MTEKQASQIMEKAVINGIPHPNILEYMEALNISIDILGTDYTRDQLKNWILINKYPFLTPKYWNPNTMQYEVDKDYKYTFTLLDEMPDGWRKAFGEMLCEEIYNALVECGGLDDYRIEQIKEKFGPMTGHNWIYPLCKKCYCTPNDYRKGDMTEEELKEFWDDRKKDWEAYNNRDNKMIDSYSVRKWSKEKDDIEIINYDISETANKIRNRYKGN